MSFFTSSTTPLFGPAWTPSSTAGYAGTCIFLIGLSVLFRALLAVKAHLEARWLDADRHRRYLRIRDPTTGRQADSTIASAFHNGGDNNNNTESAQWVVSEQGVEENVVLVEKPPGQSRRPWRASVDPVRALCDVLIAAVGYLLMLAAMTMNVGYFVSILAGVFLGSLVLGRYLPQIDH